MFIFVYNDIHIVWTAKMTPYDFLQ